MEAITEIGPLAATDTRVLFLLEKLNAQEAQLESYRSLIVSLENEIARLKVPQFQRIGITADGSISVQSISDSDIYLEAPSEPQW